MSQGREYRLWKHALGGSWARGVMLWSVDLTSNDQNIIAQHPAFRPTMTEESAIRQQVAQGLITEEVAWARLHPEEFEAKFNAEQQAAFDALKEKKDD